MEEEKKEIEKKDEEAKADESEKEPLKDGQNEEESSEEEPLLDYKAELERIRAEKERNRQGYEMRKKKEEEDGNKETPEKKVDVAELVRVETDKARADLVKDTLDDELIALTDNPDKRELIREIYESRLVKSGFSRAAIKSDLRSALVIVDAPKYEKRVKEIKKAADSERAKNSTGSTTGQKTNEEPPVKLSPLEQRILARQGLTANDVVSS